MRWGLGGNHEIVGEGWIKRQFRDNPQNKAIMFFAVQQSICLMLHYPMPTCLRST